MPLSSKILRLSLVCPIVLCLAFVGCGGEPRPDGFPKLYPVSITFVLDGVPSGGIAVFLNSQTSPWPVAGSTDQDGVATFNTQGRFPGVPAGRYKVTVAKTEQEGETVFDVINPDYGSSEKTPFEIEVIAGRNQFEPLDLGRRVRIARPQLAH